MKVAVVLMFMTGARLGNVVSRRGRLDRAVTRDDVVVASDGFLKVAVRATKPMNAQDRIPTPIGRTPSGALFDGAGLVRAFRAAAPLRGPWLAGLESREVAMALSAARASTLPALTAHSLRVGTVSTLLQAGVPAELTRTMGGGRG